MKGLSPASRTHLEEFKMLHMFTSGQMNQTTPRQTLVVDKIMAEDIYPRELHACVRY